MTSLNPDGLCLCGCGAKTKIAPRSRSATGIRKGDSFLWVQGHQKRVSHDVNGGPNPSGVCMCGCGGQTQRAKATKAVENLFKGQFNKFIVGHHQSPGLRTDGLKHCGQCYMDLPLADFTLDSRTRDGRQSPCNGCKSRNAKRRYKDQYRHIRAYHSAYRKDNPDLYRISGWKRRVSERSAPGRAAPAQIEARVSFYGRLCWICGCDWDALPKSDQTIDHVIPLARGGSNWPANLRPACRSCNSRKGKTHHKEYIA